MASTGNQIYFPQKNTLLSAPDVAALSADPLFNRTAGTPVIAATESDLPDLSTPSISNWAPQAQANALSHAIAWDEVSLEYLIEPGILATTDFALSMPTRRYYRAMDYATMRPVRNKDTHGISSAVYFDYAYAPSPVEYYRDFYSDRLLTLDCFEMSDPRAFDRDASPFSMGDDIVITGAVPTYDTACGSVGVIHVMRAQDTKSPPSSSLPLYASVTYTLGHYVPRDGQYIFTNRGGRVWWQPKSYYGTPAITRSFMRAENLDVRPGVSGTFGVSVAGRIAQRSAPPPN
jgi:hypothetical protein